MPPARLWEFAHLTPSLQKTMGWLDHVPRAGNLYIGGLHALYQRAADFEAKGVTHVVSAIDFDIYGAGHFQQYTTLMVQVEDDPNEDLLRHFAGVVEFMDGALKDGKGGVFVHCAMGKSRSATVVCAYLMWKFGVSPAAALEQLCEGRPVCDPNPGFKEQLEVWERMLKVESEGEKEALYEGWKRERFVGSFTDWEARYAAKMKAKL